MLDTFRILVLAELSGRGNRDQAGGGDLASRRRWRIDRDTFDAVFAGIAPTLRVSVPGSGAIELRFRGLDDFRPEALVERIPAAQALRDLRAKLADAARFRAARGEARAMLGKVAGEPPPPPERQGGADLLIEDLLAGAERQRDERARDWRAQVLAAIAPELAGATVPGQTAEQRAFVDAADAALGGILGAVLHDPGFQALEAAWRGVQLLVRRLETSEDLTVSVLDATSEERGDGAKVFTERDEGRPRWALVVVDEVFDRTAVDVERLRALAAAAHRAGTALVAAARPAVEDADGLAAWSALRAQPAASALALVAPRVLLRMPYGAATDPVDGFAFEEMASGFDRASLLFGSGAFAFACALGVGFARDPDDPLVNAELELDDVPSYAHELDGETVWQPGAEVALDVDAADALADLGVIPVVCAPRDTSLRLRGVFPLAGTRQRLAGPWD